MEKNIANLLGQAACTSNTLQKYIDIREAVRRKTWTDKNGHFHERTTIEPSKKGAIAGAAAGAFAGPVGAAVGGLIGLIFGPTDEDDKDGKKGA